MCILSASQGGEWYCMYYINPIVSSCTLWYCMYYINPIVSSFILWYCMYYIYDCILMYPMVLHVLYKSHCILMYPMVLHVLYIRVYPHVSYGIACTMCRGGIVFPDFGAAHAWRMPRPPRAVPGHSPRPWKTNNHSSSCTQGTEHHFILPILCIWNNTIIT